MFRRFSSAWLAVIGLLSLLGLPAFAGQWSGQLVDGGELTVDPQTRRATVHKNGVSFQARDGVHRLQDGSTLIIRAGQVVPTKEIMRAQRAPQSRHKPGAEMWVGAPIVGDSPCELLVKRVCGEDDACGEAEACRAARQLLDMENQERDAAPTRNRMTYVSGQCQEADRDRGFFNSCGL